MTTPIREIETPRGKTIVRTKHPPSDYDLYVATRIKSLRLLAEMRQQVLADSLRVCKNQISKYEKGVDLVFPERLWEIAKALDVPVSAFYEGIENGQRMDLRTKRRAINFTQNLMAIRNKEHAEVLGFVVSALSTPKTPIETRPPKRTPGHMPG